MSNDPLLQATLQLSEELLCRRPEERSIDDIQRILPWIRHRSSLFKNLEDGKCMGCAHTLNRLILYRSDLVFSAGNEPVFFVIWNRQNFFNSHGLPR